MISCVQALGIEMTKHPRKCTYKVIQVWLPTHWQRRNAHPPKSGRAVPTLHSCSTQESGPCTLPGQHNRAGPNGAGVGEPTLRARKQENWPHAWLTAARGELAGAIWRAPLVARTELVGGPYSCPGPGQDLASSTIHPSVICWSMGRDQTCRPKAAGSHNTG